MNIFFFRLRSAVLEWLDSLRAAIVWRLRRLYRRTPPQTEAGWTCLNDRFPLANELRPGGTIEIYHAPSDSLSHVYGWSLSAVALSDRRGYFWRKDVPGEQADRHFQYYLRSRRVRG